MTSVSALARVTPSGKSGLQAGFEPAGGRVRTRGDQNRLPASALPQPV